MLRLLYGSRDEIRTGHKKGEQEREDTETASRCISRFEDLTLNEQWDHAQQEYSYAMYVGEGNAELACP